MHISTKTPPPCPVVQTELPLVVHVTDALDEEYGTGLLSLLHQMPAGHYRHMVIGWQDAAMWELRHSGHITQIVSVPQAQAQLRACSRWHPLRLLQRLQRLRPALVHTHSTAVQWLAALAGVPLRLHGASPDEAPPARHGLRGWAASLLTPAPPRLPQCAVDCTQFHPRLGPAATLGPPGFLCDHAFVIGAAGPMDGRHGHLQVVQAFLQLLALRRSGPPLRLLIAGDGPERAICKNLLATAGAGHLAWLPGHREDVARLMRVMDVFAAPECAPWSGMHLLQAMASGLPVVACQGRPHSQLVQTGWTGTLVPQCDTEMLADTLADYAYVAGLAGRHGQRARQHALTHHSLASAALRYVRLYDRLLGRPDRGE
jgi:glycosyltransferase involved in cell wall biosynthesis